ncbi:MAG: hypothetical protein GXO37_05150 [Chloroflexi bacterium]|nr:hypothetical protein [Chloroflexota bacterium]
MDFLTPNLAYLLLIAAIVLTSLAVVTPGTGVLEVAAFIALGLTGYALWVLPFNTWALLILALGAGLFVQAVRKPKAVGWLIAAALAFIVGSVFLFRTPRGGMAVHPALAVVASASVGGYFWLAVRKALEAMQRPPVQDMDALIGRTGETRTPVHHEGTVYVDGELWSARSPCPIPAGHPVRVVAREGFVLVVEPLPETELPC